MQQDGLREPAHLYWLTPICQDLMQHFRPLLLEIRPLARGETPYFPHIAAFGPRLGRMEGDLSKVEKLT